MSNRRHHTHIVIYIFNASIRIQNGSVQATCCRYVKVVVDNNLRFKLMTIQKKKENWVDLSFPFQFAFHSILCPEYTHITNSHGACLRRMIERTHSSVPYAQFFWWLQFKMNDFSSVRITNILNMVRACVRRLSMSKTSITKIRIQIYSDDCTTREKERTRAKDRKTLGVVVVVVACHLQTEMILHWKISYHLNLNLHKPISSRAINVQCECLCFSIAPVAVHDDDDDCFW